MYYSKSKAGYILRIEAGEEVQESLRQFAKSVKLKGAFYQGIGTLTQVELAFFSTATKTFDRRFFDEEYELIALLGNISLSDGSPLPHSHATLGSCNFETFSGHLVRAVVSATVEIFLTSIDLSLSRKEDPLLKYKGLIFPKRVHLQIQN